VSAIRKHGLVKSAWHLFAVLLENNVLYLKNFEKDTYNLWMNYVLKFDTMRSVFSIIIEKLEEDYKDKTAGMKMVPITESNYQELNFKVCGILTSMNVKDLHLTPPVRNALCAPQRKKESDAEYTKRLKYIETFQIQAKPTPGEEAIYYRELPNRELLNKWYLVCLCILRNKVLYG
jgi:hypothetical protein